MTTLTVTIGAAIEVSNHRSLKWNVGDAANRILLGAAGSSDLFANQTVPYYFDTLELYDSNSLSVLRLAPNNGGTAEANTGEDLSRAWELSNRPAIIISAGDFNS